MHEDVRWFDRPCRVVARVREPDLPPLGARLRETGLPRMRALRRLRIPRALGFTEEATLRRRLPGKGRGELRDVVVFSLLASELSGTPCALMREACGASSPKDSISAAGCFTRT